MQFTYLLAVCLWSRQYFSPQNSPITRTYAASNRRANSEVRRWPWPHLSTCVFTRIEFSAEDQTEPWLHTYLQSLTYIHPPAPISRFPGYAILIA